MIAIVDPTANGPGVGDCWNRIGVNGDGTCPELKEHVHCRNCPIFAKAARGFFERRAPEGYLAEWADLLGRPVERGTTDSASLLVFRLGREWLAMTLSVVAEVTDLRPVHRIPHRTNRVFSGLVSLRGQLQLCVSMHGLLEVDPPAPSDEPSANPRLVVIRQGPEQWAFPAEEVVGVQHLPRDRLEKVPSTLSNPAGSFGRAVFAWGPGRSVDVLDEPRVFEALRRIGR
jgi:chemotaxis-related protein WspD